MKIAALINNCGRTISMNESGLLLLYERQKDEQWIKIQQQKYSLENIIDAEQIRKSLKEHIRILSDCHNLLVKDGRTIYRMLFENAGYHIWRFDGPAKMVFEKIAEYDYLYHKKSKEIKIKAMTNYQPLEKDTGYYYMDIRKIMSDKGIHSSAVLMPFLKSGNFKTLELDCNHMPRWFNDILGPLHLKIQDQYTDSGILKIFITKSPARQNK
ncbi:Fe-only nitrogenase accessory AnfO family protein [Pectinatus cerevisiiphilus]|uniref:Fe-only nitrogenase accessory protein AnfO n=1 Tax=Pectinatus cerevisiiphilus TaxID=86956 RepID=A0A4R3K6W2_9FIRM|nr:Fe-only nitrogenase accessory AnfO family protein [Pectinatus cerevisiiphilus]TCS78443.1 Fe-only nitrogenase accessory protein AnfO [Pectinatus cerevisiiphilus]